LCDQLNVSKGSFYHHFDGMPDFVERFATHWRLWADRLFIHMDAQPDPRRRLEMAANEAFVIMAPGVRAMRAWARTDPTIAEALASPERIWRATAVQTFAHAAEDEDSGSIFATVGNAIGIGFQSRPKRLGRERYVHLLALLYRSYGIQTDLLQSGGGPRLEVVSWDRTKSLRIDRDPLPSDDMASTAPAEAGSDRLDVRGARCHKADYFGAAAGLIREHGADGLTITALGEKLNLTAGSFQYHFGSMPRFVNEFVAHWAQTETKKIEEFLEERNPWRRLELLHAELLLEPDPADTAWRAWSHTNPVVGTAICGVDQLREHALASTIGQLVDTPDSAALAELTLAFTIGLRPWCPPFGPTLRARAAVEWMHRVVGIDASVRTEDGLPRMTYRRA
jgi:AcrR family transcriptional regulator